MVIDELQVTRLKKREGSALRGLASTSINLMGGGMIYLRNIRIMQGPKGIFVSYPSVKTKNGKYKDHFNFDKKAKKDFEQMVLADFESKSPRQDKPESKQQGQFF